MVLFNQVHEGVLFSTSGETELYELLGKAILLPAEWILSGDERFDYVI